jgi:hypothetical protein
MFICVQLSMFLAAVVQGLVGAKNVLQDAYGGSSSNDAIVVWNTTTPAHYEVRRVCVCPGHDRLRHSV